MKPYVKRNKNDAADAAAICEAVTRPTMRFVAAKSQEQQSLMMLHRTRSLLIRQRTMLVNALRAHLAEFGMVAPVGRNRLEVPLAVVCEAKHERLPALVRHCLVCLMTALRTVEHEIATAERRIHAWHRSSEACPSVPSAAATLLLR